MPPESRRRRNTVVVLLLLLLLVLLLLLRCARDEPVPAPAAAPAPTVTDAAPVRPAPSAPPADEPAELLTAATLDAPAEVGAGAVLAVAWTGPDNAGDFIALALIDAPAEAALDYRETRAGAAVELTAPIEPGAYELRYVTGRSRTVLARQPLAVGAASATLDAPAEVVLGSAVAVAWTGPANTGDYVTIVPQATPDAGFGDYATTDRGSPLTVLAPTTAGEGEVRYVTGQGRKVLARRPVRIDAPEVTLDAPEEAVAGATIQVAWVGPGNAGDYVTVVAADARAGDFGNYTTLAGKSPVALLLPIAPGAAELRYMTGRDAQVLQRRPIRIVAAEVTLSAPAEAVAGTPVTIDWTGPDNAGDYVTVVAAAAPDGAYGSYASTSGGSPLAVKAPAEPGPAEVRYMTGQGGKVLARRALAIVR
jgi:Ca-activated chloride channel family protein